MNDVSDVYRLNNLIRKT